MSDPIAEPTTGLPLELLKKFCRDDTSRGDLTRPIHANGFAYATDGLILVRTTSTFPDSVLLSNTLHDTLPSLLKDFPTDDSTEWTQVPDGDPRLEKCETCGGTGKSQECPSCDGRGDVDLDHSWKDNSGKWHTDAYECECQHCEGTGRIGGSGESCEDCDGKGESEVATPIKFGAAWINAVLTKKLRALPGQQIHPRLDRSPLKSIPIRGDGWVGVLMPCRAPEEM